MLESPIYIGLCVYSLATSYLAAKFFMRRDRKYKKELKAFDAQYESMIRCIEQLEINELQREAWRYRYVESIKEMHKESLDARDKQFKIDIYNIGLSATITVLTAAESPIENYVSWVSVGLCIAILSSLNTFWLSFSAQRGLKEKWLNSRRSWESLASEFWAYVTQSQQYAGRTHEETAAAAIGAIEYVYKQSVENNLAVANQRKNGVKGIEGSRRSTPVEPTESMGGLRSEVSTPTPSAASPSVGKSEPSAGPSFTKVANSKQPDKPLR